MDLVAPHTSNASTPPPTVINNNFPVLLMLADLKAALASHLNSFKSQERSTVASRQQGLSPRQKARVEFACSVFVHMVDFHHPNTSTSDMTVSLSVNSCSYGLVIYWPLIQSRCVTCLRLKTAGTDSSNTRDPECTGSVDRWTEARCNSACFCQFLSIKKQSSFSFYEIMLHLTRIKSCNSVHKHGTNRKVSLYGQQFPKYSEVHQ